MRQSVIIDRLKNNQFTLIAEIGVNYYDIAEKMDISNIDAAKLMIRKAAGAGIHAVKFQSYKASTLASKNSPSYWDRSEEPTASQFELFQKFDSFGEREYKQLSEHANELGVEFLSTPFDKDSADYLYDFMHVYKISSSDITNLPFIEYQARKNKPILLSIGASNLDEIERAVKLIKKYNEQPLTLLHCVLEYPTPRNHANLLKIRSLKEAFPDCFIGYSDHTKPEPGQEIIKTAYNLGATVIEKHFTLDKTLKGNDHYHAMDPDDAMEILSEVEKLDILRGNGEIKALESETAARQNARRSIVARREIPAGTVLTPGLLTAKRPGTGISPAKLSSVIGCTAVIDIPEDSIITKDMISGR